MASKKPSNTSLPHANRPKVPTGSSIKRSASDESSMRRNLKRPVVESSQLGDDIEEQDAIFRPWRSLSNPQDTINEESELDLLFGKDKVTGSNAAGPKERQRQWIREAANSSEDAPQVPTNEESSCALPSKDQVETKWSKNKAIEFVCEELRSIKSGMDAVAMALEKGNVRNYSEEQLYDEITKVEGLSEISEMKVYQALSADPNSARAFLACPIARRELWLKVKFGNQFVE